jgi:hypothetical protein
MEYKYIALTSTAGGKRVHIYSDGSWANITTPLAASTGWTVGMWRDNILAGEYGYIHISEDVGLTWNDPVKFSGSTASYPICSAGRPIVYRHVYSSEHYYLNSYSLIPIIGGYTGSRHSRNEIFYPQAAAIFHYGKNGLIHAVRKSGSLYYSKSEDFGATWSEEVVAYDRTMWDAAVEYYSFIANGNNLALVFLHTRSDSYIVGMDEYWPYPSPIEYRERTQRYYPTDVWVVISNDGGDTWNDPVVINHSGVADGYAYGAWTGAPASPPLSTKGISAAWYDGSLYICSNLYRIYLSTNLVYNGPNIFGWSSTLEDFDRTNGLLLERVSGETSSLLDFYDSGSTDIWFFWPGTLAQNNKSSMVIVAAEKDGNLIEMMLDGAVTETIIDVSEISYLEQLSLPIMCNGGGGYSFWW